MSKLSNTNTNNVSIKTDSMVKMIRELSKLGVFKKKQKPRRASLESNVGRQDGNTMVGYVKTLGGPQMRNIPPIQTIEAGMTKQQIEDIQRTNAARFAALTGEVSQLRSDTQQAGSALFDIVKPIRDQLQEDKAFDPLQSRRTGFIEEVDVPDVNETDFSQSLNQGAPKAKPVFASSTFPEEETGNIPTSLLAPLEKIRPPVNRNIRNEIAISYGLNAVPVFKPTTRPDMQAYYEQLGNNTGYDVDETLFTSKEKMFDDINRILNELALTR
jgi:hypothetical protein